MKIGVIFGGKSAEHEVSILSARSVINVIDKNKFEIIPIGITRDGLWCHCDNDLNFGKCVTFLEACSSILSKIDIAFPVLHGPFGEDGTIQGFFEIASIPYVGAGVLGSAIGLDKDVTKRLLVESGILVAEYLVFDKPPNYKDVTNYLGSPCIIKSSNMGSSICLTKAWNEIEFYEGVELAFEYDKKIIIEKNICGRELECSILGLRDPIASLPGEIAIKDGGMYTYEAKYLNEEMVELIIPAILSKAKVAEVQSLALKTFKILCCDGMARVDFFMDYEEKLYVNEINTIPGFTEMSMYPKLWQISGISYTRLIEHLIEIAIKRFQQSLGLKNSTRNLV